MLFCTSIAYADEVSEAFSGKAPEAVVKSTRHLIRSGFNRRATIEVTRAMLQNQFNVQQILDAHTVLMNAHQQGIAPEPIISKAHEGMSKHVAAGNIVKAMKKVQSRYIFAHRQAQKLTARKSQVNQMGHIMAAGLAAGVDSIGLETIVNELQARLQEMNTDQQSALAIETFKATRDMARLGVSSSQTVSVMVTALQHQFDNRQMQNMRAAFVKNSRTTAPQRLAAGYAAAIAKGSNFRGSDNSRPGKSGGSGPGDSGGGSGSGGSGGGSGSGGTGGGSGSGGSGGGSGSGGSGGGSGSGGSGGGSGSGGSGGGSGAGGSGGSGGGSGPGGNN
jgi:hypothetical protein